MHPAEPPPSMLSMSTWQAWLDSPPGRYMLEWEQAECDRAVADVFGYNAMQIGMPQLDTLRCNRMPFVAFFRDWRHPVDQLITPLTVLPMHASGEALQATPRRAFEHQIVGRFEELPFASQSLDLLVLPHALEFAEEPHQVLREVDRVLIPDGRVVITGFNPWSLWGLRQQGFSKLGDPWLPNEGQFIGVNRLRDWLKLLSFEMEGGQFGCHGWPCRSQRWFERMAWMEEMGQKWWGALGGVYCVRAVKRVRAMRLIGPAWRESRARGAAVVAPIGKYRGHVQERSTER